MRWFSVILSGALIFVSYSSFAQQVATYLNVDQGFQDDLSQAEAQLLDIRKSLAEYPLLDWERTPHIQEKFKRSLRQDWRNFKASMGKLYQHPYLSAVKSNQSQLDQRAHLDNMTLMYNQLVLAVAFSPDLKHFPSVFDAAEITEPLYSSLFQEFLIFEGADLPQYFYIVFVALYEPKHGVATIGQISTAWQAQAFIILTLNGETQDPVLEKALKFTNKFQITALYLMYSQIGQNQEFNPNLNEKCELIDHMFPIKRQQDLQDFEKKAMPGQSIQKILETFDAAQNDLTVPP